jgi:DNA-binding GntR family transcriptional regulator
MSDTVEPPRGVLIDRIHARIREEILNQRLRPGVKLTAEHLATMLDVSRTPVRQALERLSQEGYVTRVPARGFFVAEIGVAEVRDLYDVRRALEAHALNGAFDRGIAAADVAQVIEVEAVYQQLVREDTIVGRAEADQEFHVALAALSGNAVLVKMIREIFDRLNFRRRYDGYWYWGSRGTRGSDAAAEHLRLLSALERGDRDGAIGELRSHLGRAWHNYERFLTTSAALNPPSAVG